MKRVLLISILFLSIGCASSTAVEPTAVPTTAEQEGTVASAAVASETAVIEITSDSGIGNETFRPEDGWASEIVLRFHLSGLEEMRLMFGDTAVTLNITSTGQNEIFQSVSQNGQTANITADSPYWMPVTITQADGTEGTIPLQNGTINVTLPPAFYTENPDSFTISWIDFYR